MPFFRTLVALALTAVASSQALAQTFPVRYSITATLPAPVSSAPDAVAFRLNNTGQAAGYGFYRQGTVTRLVFINGWWRFVRTPVERGVAVSWTGGTPTVLKPLSSSATTLAAALNDSGWVAGQAFKSATAAKGYAVVWRAGQVTELGAGLDSEAIEVNANGWVLGSRVPSGDYIRQPFLWRNNRVESLGPYPAGVQASDARCVGLSDAGTVICLSLQRVGIDDISWRSFVWNNGSFQELTYPGATTVVVSEISPAGVVAGLMKMPGDVGTYGDPGRPFLWRAGQFTLLPRVPGELLASITDVNDDGTVVADVRSATVDKQQVWTAAGAVIDVKDLSVTSGDTIVRVLDINDRGSLLATVRRGATGAERQVVLAPAP